MTCEALINKFLMDYHAGMLPLARKLDFEVHLALCQPCRKYVASYRRTVELAKATKEPEEAAPAELVEMILKLTRDKK